MAKGQNGLLFGKTYGCIQMKTLPLIASAEHVDRARRVEEVAPENF